MMMEGDSFDPVLKHCKGKQKCFFDTCKGGKLDKHTCHKTSIQDIRYK